MQRRKRTLKAAVDLDYGQLIQHLLGSTHKEFDFTAYPQTTVVKLPGMVSYVVNFFGQPVTHPWETLVRWIDEEAKNQGGDRWKNRKVAQATQPTSSLLVLVILTISPRKLVYETRAPSVGKSNFKSVEQPSRRSKLAYYNK